VHNCVAAPQGLCETAVAPRRRQPPAPREESRDVSDAEAKPPVVIKKYANRRLYNTAKSTYVTLEHLAEMVRGGTDFVVNDAKTGEDITRSVLTQIIFEEESRGQNMLPISFLRQLIRLYGDTLAGFVPGYLESAMNTFASNQERMREQVRAAFDANPAFANFEALARTNMEWFENALRMFAPFMAGSRTQEPARRERRPEPPPEAPAAGREVDLEAMQRQIAEMQATLARLAERS
jgi:polyhydroxyalkanoate synthesis repressor PhaR